MPLQYIDSRLVSSVRDSLDDKSLKNISDNIAADFAVNYFLHNLNVAQLFHGDYVNYFKKNKAQEELEKQLKTGNVSDLALLYDAVKETFDNLGKRLAADLAPGYEADYGESKPFIKVTTSNDRNVKSLASDIVKEVFKDGKKDQSESDKNSIAAWSNINSSDAQSWSSLEFHLDTLYNFGNKLVSETDYKKLKAKIKEARDNNKYNELDFSQDELSIILNPTKPLYSNNRQVPLDGDSTIGVRSYIKTSSFPLIPQLVKGTDLEHVVNAMENGGVDLHVFESGYKVGSTIHSTDSKADSNSKLDLFDKDGNMLYDNVAALSDSKNHIILDIKGFKIQQEVPYHDHPGYINKGSQESKLLFSNIRAIEGFEYDGKKMNGAELEKIYNQKYKELYRKEAEKLRNEVFVKDADGNPTGQVDIHMIQKLFREAANDRNYSINDKIGLSLDDKNEAFKFPLWCLPAAHKYESLLISIVDNRVRKLKIPGNSFVLGSEAGFRFKDQIITDKKDQQKIFKKYQDQIIFTSNAVIENGEINLQTYRRDGKNMKPTQVFIPCKLQGKNGHFIDLMKYTIKKDGRLYIDENRFPKELSNMFGFRIPTQGHNSMTSIEVAGFLPEACGDLIIATQDLVVQMGSDKR